MKKFIPEHILNAMEYLRQHGYSPYLVGGCVRDYVMNRVPNDYDITVDAVPEEILNVFTKQGFRAELSGKEFGTVAVYAEGEKIEITPHRIEGSYSDSRHPDSVSFVKDLKLDLKRRDFTVNALAMNCDYTIVDIYGGIDDIKNKIIRCVGESAVRFSEDALRILRAIRFAARFGFTIENTTLLSMHKLKSSLSKLSGERIQAELSGILFAKYSYEILSEYEVVLDAIIPNFHASKFLSSTNGDFAERLFSCIYSNDYDIICNICNFVKLSKSDSEKIRTLHKLYHDILTKQNGKVIFDDKAKIAVCDYGSNNVYSVFDITFSDCTELSEFIKNSIYEPSKLAFSGGDIALCGLFPKHLASFLLKETLHSVAIGKTENTKSGILNFLCENFKKNNRINLY